MCPRDVDLIKQSVKMYSYRSYDSLRVPTICYGQNLLEERTKLSIDALSATANFPTYASIMSGNGCLSEAQCTRLMQHDLESARRGVKDIYGDWIGDVCPCANNALVDMTYSLHQGAMAELWTFNSLIAQGNWDHAALDLVTGTYWCQ